MFPLLKISDEYSAEGFHQYFMPPDTQNVINIGPQNEFSNTAFWDYLPFLEQQEYDTQGHDTQGGHRFHQE